MKSNRIFLEQIPKRIETDPTEEYFDQLVEEIFSNTIEKKKKVFLNTQKYWMAAASLILVLGVWFSYATNSELQIADLQDHQILYYLETELAQDGELSDLFYKNTSKIEFDLNDIEKSNLSNDELLEILELEGEI